MKALYSDGLIEYISDLWNIVDFISNSFYVAWMTLRFTSWYVVNQDAKSGLNPWYPREDWSSFDPMLLSKLIFIKIYSCFASKILQTKRGNSTSQSVYKFPSLFPS